MPKETVHWGKRYISRDHPETDKYGAWSEELPFDGIPEGATLPETDTVTRSPKLEVFWDRPDKNTVPFDEDADGFVQIGMIIDKHEFDQRVRQDLDHATERGFYTRKLTRTQINEMIRVLKRARNAAFGVDE